MKQFTFEVEVRGFQQVTVSAETQEEAEELVGDRIMEGPVADLRSKSFICKLKDEREVS